MNFRALATIGLLAFVWSSTARVQAQTRVTGRAIDQAGEPVASVNVQLLHAADSSFVHGTIAGDDGRFVLETIESGEYLLYISLIGYKDYLSEPLRISAVAERDVGAVRLLQDAIRMEEVSIEARRTLYEQKGNRLVINVGTSIGIVGGSALDLLKRSPGVMVNEQSGVLSMLGKDGVRVMIDGRLRYIEGDALISFLAGLSADNVESIELITSPPADLDAEGNAGFINIILKQSRDEGLNGSLSASSGYGFGQGGVGNGSASLHYVGRDLSLNGSYSFLWNGQKQLLANYRRIDDPGGTLELPALSHRDPVVRVHNFRVGGDYEISERTTVGALVSGYQNKFSMDALTELTIMSDGAAMSRSESDIDMFNRWRHLMGSVNVRHEPDSARTFGADLDYLVYHNEMPTQNVNTLIHVGSGSVVTSELSSGKKTPLSITVAKVDYEAGIGGGWELGAGAKTAFSRFTNRMSFSQSARRDWMSEHALSSKSVLREDVLAAYGKAGYRRDSRHSVEMGLRYELTDTELDTDETAGLVDRRWGRFFPNVVYTFEKDPGTQATISYTRRVSRPAFNDLASFSRFDDPYTLFTGNAGLQPAVTDAVKLDITYRSLFGAIEYAREDSSIARFQSRIVSGENVMVIFPTNFDHTDRLSMLLGLPVRLIDWWSSQNDLIVTRQHVDGVRNGTPVEMNRTFFRFNSTQNLSLPFGVRLEASGFYQNATLFGVIRWEPMWGINMALQRTLPSGNGTLTFTVEDVFDSVDWSWTTGSPGDPVYAEQVIDMAHRTFKLSYSRRFGTGQTTRARTTASEEESQRITN